MNRLAKRGSAHRMIAVVLVVSAFGAACSSSGSDSKASDKTTTTAASTTTASPSSGSSSAPPSTGSATTAPVATTSGTSTPTGGSAFCSKLSDSEVQAVLGVKVVRREPHSGVGGSESCIKGTPRQADISTSSFVSFSTFLAAGQFTSVDKIKAALPGSKDVSGVGDGAVYNASVGAVYGLVGGKAFSVQVDQRGKRGNEADTVQLAKALVGRLG